QDLVAQVFRRGEVPPADHLAHDDPQDDLHLVHPRTVLGRVDEAHAVRQVTQELLPGLHRLQRPLLPFLPRSSSSPHSRATSSTSPAEQWMFRLSSTNTYRASGSSFTVLSMCFTKSASVRVGPSVGASSSPVTTWKLPISVTVPCRWYSNSRRSTWPGFIGCVKAIRCKAWMPVISSTQRVCVSCQWYSAAAS